MNVALTEKQFDLIIDSNQLINEAWYNTVLDIVGWADPTGIVDAVNGVSYMVQGDYLFGFLSFVSAIPYAGDVVAKPVLHALKIGKPSARALNKVMALSKAGKTAEAAKALQNIMKSDSFMSKFVYGVSRHTGKLEQLVNSLPGGVLKGFRETILDWIKLFKNAGKPGIKAQRLARQFSKLSKEQQIGRLQNLQKVLANSKGPFRGYSKDMKFFSFDNLRAGMPQLMSQNRELRALMRKSKWYLGLLDFMGIGNFVGPDELMNKIGDENFEKEVAEYNKTQESEQYFSEEFGDGQNIPYEEKPKEVASEPKNTVDPFELIIKQLFPI